MERSRICATIDSLSIDIFKRFVLVKLANLKH